jgi:YHS domain-containing protein
MPDTTDLASRIDAEFSAVEEKMKQFRAEKTEEFKERQKRLEQLGKAFDELRDVWRPRLEVLVNKFGERVQVKPRVTPSAREADFAFQSRLARVRLRLSATTDRDIHKVVLSYDLEISPVLMRFNPHAEVEFPLTAIDKAAVAKWIDDRVVEFVRTYLSMGENELYMKDLMVEDPITHVRFPSAAAGATLEWQGQKYYFIGEETRREFEKQHGIGPK